jgi:hypothetical protein
MGQKSNASKRRVLAEDTLDDIDARLEHRGLKFRDSVCSISLKELQRVNINIL